MSFITLTAQERERFAAWLEQEATTDEQIIPQVETLSGMQPYISRLRLHVAACRLLAHKLRSIGEMWI